MLRYVMHNWPTSKAIKFLKQLRDVAVPGKTRLLVDSIPSYACKDNAESQIEVQDLIPLAPEPLQPNYGRASATTYLMDIQYASFTSAHLLLSLISH